RRSNEELERDHRRYRIPGQSDPRSAVDDTKNDRAAGPDARAPELDVDAHVRHHAACEIMIPDRNTSAGDQQIARHCTLDRIAHCKRIVACDSAVAWPPGGFAHHRGKRITVR